ncbi:MAG TPA: extensin family protein, partial [Xanthobacteraceae bacterium]|nr:extensin family protein [Xanthobacteraceae bacterium]
MARTFAKYLLVSIVFVMLAACARSWFAERPPWRHDAEVACLKSGAVKEGAGITQLRPIEGPGICGADFPLRVTALGENGPLGFADDPRPPGTIPQYSPPPGPPAPPAPTYGTPAPDPPAAASGAPMPITPRELDQPVADGPYAPYPEQPAYGAPPATYPAQPSKPIETVPLAPSRDMGLAAPVSVTPAATLACPLVSALDTWMASAVQPAARRWFGQPVVEIKQISAYSCRSMNNQPGASISEHAFGNALDIAAFTFADGRKVTVRDGWHGPPEEQAFLHDVHASACRLFATVLAPGSNAFHYDHMHVDLARHASGRSICEPAPIPGDLVAGARRPLVTGSIAPPAPRPARPAATRPIPTDD